MSEFYPIIALSAEIAAGFAAALFLAGYGYNFRQRGKREKQELKLRNQEERHKAYLSAKNDYVWRELAMRAGSEGVYLFQQTDSSEPIKFYLRSGKEQFEYTNVGDMLLQPKCAKKKCDDRDLEVVHPSVGLADVKCPHHNATLFAGGDVLRLSGFAARRFQDVVRIIATAYDKSEDKREASMDGKTKE